MEHVRRSRRTAHAAVILALATGLAALALAACGEHYYGSTSFADSQHGWVTGWDGVKSKTIVQSTTDGGKTWTRVGSRATPEGVPVAGWAEFTSPTTGVWAAGIGSPLYTTTGGRPWARGTTLNLKGHPLKARHFFSAADFASAKVGWAAIVRQYYGGGLEPHEYVEAGGWIARTGNAGVTWRIKKAVVGDMDTMTGTFVDVASPVGRVAFAVKTGLRGGVYVTKDRGATWKRRTLPGDTKGYQAVAFVNVKTGWAVGNGGMIAKTTDGGASWTAQVSGVDVALHGVCFVNADVGWAVGAMGTIVATVDGGAHWAPQVSGWVPDPAVEDDDMILHDVDFVSATEGWIVSDTGWAPGLGGAILHTTNGGTTWTLTK